MTYRRLSEEIIWDAKCVERIPLRNGLILEIWNYSRKLAGDRWLVGFLAQIEVIPDRDDFSNSFYYEKFYEKTEGKFYYRYRKERTFVPEAEVGRIFEEIKENFFKAALPYISREDFPFNLIRREVALFEKQVDWELYLRRKEEEQELLEKVMKDKEIL
ncbi:MAG: hypothetical protein N2327_00380 [Caldimicrobium sp.]|nr:hypothetical protein [Caldimicrobium sp.]MCX7872884.1 hypothetical protein [Caldimicrobium sp.]MDW8093538.1 hypothetical protein [Caldimicrobium sp.]